MQGRGRRVVAVRLVLALCVCFLSAALLTKTPLPRAPSFTYTQCSLSHVCGCSQSLQRMHLPASVAPCAVQRLTPVWRQRRLVLMPAAAAAALCRSEAQELGCAKQHLEQQLGRRVVAMLGHSKGATDVLMYAGCYAQQVRQQQPAAAATWQHQQQQQRHMAAKDAGSRGLLGLD